MKAERTTAREQRKKIMGVNEKIHTSEDKYLESYNTSNKNSFKIPDNRVQYGDQPQNYNNMGSYDSYGSQNSLTMKIGSIMEGVDKMQSKMEKQERLVY